MSRIAELTDGGEVDIDLRSLGVHVRVPSLGGFTEQDVEAARAVSAAARDLGLIADPTATQAVQFTVDCLDKSAVMPFWRAALGYEQDEDDLTDPMRRDPGLWFQQRTARGHCATESTSMSSCRTRRQPIGSRV